MLIHTGPMFTVYFGDAQDGIKPEDFYCVPDSKQLLSHKPFERLKKLMGIESLVFLHQTHSADGYVVMPDELDTFKPFALEGDYLLTGAKIGLGVMTADCLPIVMHDNVNNVAMVIHAGWRGSMQKIAVKALEHMQKVFNTDPLALRIIFGPSAKACCYEVQPDFMTHLDAFEFGNYVVRRQGEQLFFDLPLFNRMQLEACGIRKEAFCMEYNLCTICHDAFYSYRRQKEQAGRQMTVISLK